MPAAKTLNVGNAEKVAKERAAKVGPTVEVRAIARGQYGYPYAFLREPGTVFRMAVKDLGPPKSGGHPISGVAYATIKYDGQLYGLPSWVVDAKTPIEETPDTSLVATTGDESDDVL